MWLVKRMNQSNARKQQEVYSYRICEEILIQGLFTEPLVTLKETKRDPAVIQ